MKIKVIRGLKNLNKHQKLFVKDLNASIYELLMEPDRIDWLNHMNLTVEKTVKKYETKTVFSTKQLDKIYGGVEFAVRSQPILLSVLKAVKI